MSDQAFLFDELDTSWQREWVGMPEYSHEDLTPWKSLVIHFETIEDLQAFGQLIGQRLYETTRSTWYPQAEIGRMRDRRYIDT